MGFTQLVWQALGLQPTLWTHLTTGCGILVTQLVSSTTLPYPSAAPATHTYRTPTVVTNKPDGCRPADAVELVKFVMRSHLPNGLQAEPSENLKCQKDPLGRLAT